MSSEVEIIQDDFIVTAVEEYNRAKDSMCLLMWIKDKKGHVLDSSVHYRKSVHDVKSNAKVFLTNFRDKVHISEEHERLEQKLRLAIDTLEEVAQSACKCNVKARAALKVIKKKDIVGEPKVVEESTD